MTDLASYQQAFARVCFDREPSDADLALLVDPKERWILYRQMVRHRLFAMARSGLPKSSELLGKARFDDAVVRYLAERPPKTRFIREVVHELVDHTDWTKHDDLPHLADLVRYEDLKWRVGSLPWAETPPLSVELEFESVPVVNPTARGIDVHYRVDKSAADPARLDAPHRVLVYRRPDKTRVYTYLLNPIGAELFDAWARGLTCADGTRAVLTARKRQPDAEFIEGMASVLADLVDKQVILGTRR